MLYYLLLLYQLINLFGIIKEFILQIEGPYLIAIEGI